MTKRLFWNKKHLIHKTIIKSLIKNIVTCFQLNIINQYQFIYNKTRFYWYVIEPKLIHLDSYYICFIFKANIVTWTCFAKFQNPLAVHIETKNSSTGLQYAPNYSLTKKANKPPTKWSDSVSKQLKNTL